MNFLSKSQIDNIKSNLGAAISTIESRHEFFEEKADRTQNQSASEKYWNAQQELEQLQSTIEDVINELDEFENSISDY